MLQKEFPTVIIAYLASQNKKKTDAKTNLLHIVLLLPYFVSLRSNLYLIPIRFYAFERYKLQMAKIISFKAYLTLETGRILF